MIGVSKTIQNLPFIRDFRTFINYCEEVKPRLTKSKEYINRKSLYDLNQKLIISAKDVNPRIDQQYYLPIHFYYQLAVEAELVLIDRSKKNAFLLIPNVEKINIFRQLSPVAQYIFLLKTYWVYCDWEAISDDSAGRVSIDMADRFLKLMTAAQVNKTYSKEKKDKIVDSGNWLLNEHLLFWEYLGWLRVLRSNDFDTKSFFAYDEITVTELGKVMAQLLSKERTLKKWNEAYLINGPNMFDAPLMELIGMEDDDDDLDMVLPKLSENPSQEEVFQNINLMEKQGKEALGIDLNLMDMMKEFMKKGKPPTLEDIMNHITDRMEDEVENLPEPEPFETTFQTIFQDKIIPDLTIKAPIKFKDGQYLLKVSLDDEPKIWRKVALNAKHTLLDLHSIIQTAFNFDDDHLYVFHLDRQQRKSYYDPRSENYPTAQDMELGALGLSPNQRIYYIFDFGDYWEFNIDLLEIIKDKKSLKQPKVIAKQGEAPEQYPHYDDDDEWY